MKGWWLLGITLFMLIASSMNVAAHCPLCTGAIGAAAVSAKMMGVDSSIIGVFIGAFGISTGIWAARWIAKKTQRQLGLLVTGCGIALLLILLFLKIDTDENAVALCKELHGNISEKDFEPCPLHKGSNSWAMVLAFSLISVMVVIGVSMIFMQKSLEHKKAFNIDIKSLDDEEKKIVEKIKEKEGSIYQSDLIKETGYSKVKITRILDKLESKGILEKKRRGMTNIVVLR